MPQRSTAISGTPAIFLDRDDTLIACRSIIPDGDLGDPALVRLLPGALETCRTLKKAGFSLVVVSNQGGVARGRYSLEAVEAVNTRLNSLLEGCVDAFRVCPFHPRGVVPDFTREHPWRKPAPGMILDAASALGLDLGRSWLIGDAERDCQAGRAAGLDGRTILLTRPDPALAPSPFDGAASIPHFTDHLAADLPGAAAIILRRHARTAP